MSVNGALFAGVSGLKAESATLGVISNNISNANTVGYKAGTGQFETLVTDSGAGGAGFSPGGVLARPVQMIDQQGLLQATSSSTDVGITGRGFFVVANQLTSTGAVATTTPRDFTRAGSFTLDKSGNLVNTAGYFLLGVPTDTKGNPTTANPVIEGLQPVNVGTLTGIAKGTSELSIGANLPAVPTSPSHMLLSGTLDGINSFADPTHYVLYSSTGNAYDAQVLYNRTSATTYDIQLINMTPIGTSKAVDTTKSTLPVTIGSVTLTAGGGTVSGGTAVTFTDGSTLQPVLDVTHLRLDSTLGNNLDRIAVDAQDVSTTVYDSLGVAQTLTVEFSRGSDLSRTVSSPVNNVTLKGTIDTTAAAGTKTAVPGSVLLTGSDGTVYRATMQYDITGANAADLEITSLTPLGPGTTPPVGTFPTAVANLAITANSTVITPVTINLNGAGTVTLTIASGTQTTLTDPGTATTSIQAANANTTFTVPAATTNKWVTTIRDMTVAATGQSSTVFPQGAVTGFPIYLDGTAATALGSVTTPSDTFSLSGTVDGVAAAGSFALGSMRIVGSTGDAYMASLQFTHTGAGGAGTIDITGLTAIGNAPAPTLAFPQPILDLSTAPFTLSADAALPVTLAAGVTFNPGFVDQAVNITAGAAGSDALVANVEESGSSTPLSAAALASSIVTFNNDGTIATNAPSTIPQITMADGAKPFGGSTFTLNLGTPNTAGGLTQFTDQFAVSFLNQDGVRFGFRTGVAFDKNGLVSAVFDNGQSIPLFKVPLVNFANVNQLQAITGDVFGQTTDSGDPVPNFPGVGGTGQLTPSTLEQSTVDLSTEFANLIVTQRSFSADARTITTSDAMLQELIDIKR